ncbi:MAG: hypothetical protein NUV69_01885 [Candidatus Curtissbacteria bacterium]|nr:hypothetical protein [Candidatus Curtissbacteria bacterium]
MTPDRDGQDENPIRTDLRNRYMAVQGRVVEIGKSGETVGEEEAVRLAFMWSYLGSVEFPTNAQEDPDDPYSDELKDDGVTAREAVVDAQHGDYKGLKSWLNEVSGGFTMLLFWHGGELSQGEVEHIGNMAQGLGKIGELVPDSGIPLHPGLFPGDGVPPTI